MLIYLDVSALKRPFDDQHQERIATETAAVFAILSRIKEHMDELIWSDAINFENQADGDEESRSAVADLEQLATRTVSMDGDVGRRVLALSATGALRSMRHM